MKNILQLFVCAVFLTIGLQRSFGQTHLVISQVYGGAGCGTVGCSTYKNDYIEIFNPTNATVNVNGWSVQYADAAGSAWQVTNLPNFTLQPGQFLLIAQSAGANGVNNLPTPDATGTVAMNATAGKVALVNNTIALSVPCPAGAQIIDLLGYGATANCFETAPAPAPGTTSSAARSILCIDNNNNSNEFSAIVPNPRNSSSPLSLCAAVISGKLTDVISIDNFAPGIANPTDEITYKNTIKNTGNATATGVTVTEPTPGNTTLVPGSEVTSALARNDNFSTSYNTTLSTANVITNDYGLPSVTVVSFGTVASLGSTTPSGSAGATTAGGILTVNSNGTFNYTPPLGFSGTDQFMYIATTGAAGLPNNDALVSITINPDLTFATTQTNPLCNGGTTGTLTFTMVSGGSGSGYTYSITGAAGTYFASPIFTGLNAGTYNLAVKDGAGYIKTGTATLNDPPLLSFTHVDVNNVCNGGTIGSITFTATGGTGTITYSITGSAGTYQASNVFNALASGVYNLAVKDANGCISTGTATITSPAVVTFTFTKTDVTCFGLNNGSIVFNTTSGGTSPYTYSISGTGGTFQASNTFTGLTPGVKSLVAKDVNGCNSAVTSSTILEPAQIIVSGTIPNLIHNTAMATATFTKTGGSGSPASPWSATGLPAGITINTVNGGVTGTPTVTGTFNATITYTDANGCTGSKLVTFNVAPNLANNAYTAVVGNTQLVADGYSTPSTPYTSSATNILTNDSPAGITVTAVTNAATTAGGSITISTDGKFIYTPPTGSTAADTYTYTGTSNGVSSTATISFTIANMIWYVNNTYAGANGASDGRSHRPFADVAAAEAASAINHTIYVHTGSGLTSGNALLKTGQTLRGAGSALTLGALSIVAGTKPTLSGMITLANNVTVDGFDMNTGTTTAFTNAGNTVTGVTVNVGNVTTTTGTGINLTGSGNNVTMTLASLTTNGATNGVNINNTAGTITANGGTLTGAASGSTFNVVNGTANITYSGNITQNGANRVINIDGPTSGTIIFQTGIITGGSSSTGINLNNVNGNVTFSNGMTLGTSGSRMTSQALTVNGGTGTYSLGNVSIFTNNVQAISILNSDGTVNATGVVDATNGRAMIVDGPAGFTTLGISFTRIASSSSSTTSITLRETRGSFAVTGTGTTTGTGGVISQSSAGAGNEVFDFGSQTFSPGTFNEGIGIFLNDVTNISLSNMNFTGTFGNFAIRGELVNGFTFKESNITATSGTSDVGGINEGSIRLGTASRNVNGISGTVLFEGSNIGGGYSDNVGMFITNSASATITFKDGANPAIIGLNHVTGGNDGIIVETNNGNATILVDNVQFTGARGDLFQSAINGSGSQNITFINNTCHNSHSNIVSGGGGITLNGGGNTSNYTVTYLINNNSFRGAVGTPLFVGYVGQSIAASGVVTNNIIGVDDAGNPQASTALATTGASGFGNGIWISSEKFSGTGVVTHASRVENNQVRDVTGTGLAFRCNNQSGGSARVEITAKNNIVEEVGDFSFSGIYSIVGGAGGADNGSMGVDFRNNNINLNNSSGADGDNNAIAFDQIALTSHYYSPGYAGSPQGESSVPAGTASTALSNFFTSAPRSNILVNGEFLNGPLLVDAIIVKGFTGEAFVLPVPLMAEKPNFLDIPLTSGNILEQPQLDQLVKAAIRRWDFAGATTEQLDKMRNVTVNIEKLLGSQLGTSTEENASIDDDGAGTGWFIDPTPDDDNEFTSEISGLNANIPDAINRYDLLTAIMHELGHQVGIEDVYATSQSNNLMHGILKTGERRLPVQQITR